MSEQCECKSMAGYGPESFGRYHHKKCDKYKTEKYPTLFYMEEAENCWCPIESTTALESIFDLSNYDDGEKFKIEFKRSDMTDEEYDAIPEV